MGHPKQAAGDEHASQPSAPAHTPRSPSQLTVRCIDHAQVHPQCRSALACPPLRPVLEYRSLARSRQLGTLEVPNPGVKHDRGDSPMGPVRRPLGERK